MGPGYVAPAAAARPRSPLQTLHGTVGPWMSAESASKQHPAIRRSLRSWHGQRPAHPLLTTQPGKGHTFASWGWEAGRGGRHDGTTLMITSVVPTAILSPRSIEAQAYECHLLRAVLQMWGHHIPCPAVLVLGTGVQAAPLVH
jgi:hypothetical protein